MSLCKHRNGPACPWCAMEKLSPAAHAAPPPRKRVTAEEAWARATHCKNGHERNKENAYLRWHDGRPAIYCRVCERIKRMNRYRKTGK